MKDNGFLFTEDSRASTSFRVPFVGRNLSVSTAVSALDFGVVCLPFPRARSVTA